VTDGQTDRPLSHCLLRFRLVRRALNVGELQFIRLNLVFNALLLNTGTYRVAR